MKRKQPRSLIYQSWTPPQIRSAGILADGGNLRMAADLCEHVMRDSRVRGVLGARVSGLLGLDLLLKPATGGESVAQDLQTQWDVHHDHRELSRLCAWGIILGVGLAHVDYEPGPDGVTRKYLRTWHPRWLRWDDDLETWFVQVGQVGNEIPITPGDGEWILYTPYGQTRPWSLAPWHDLAVLWLLKMYCRDDFGRHSEIHGNPIRVGEAPQGASEPDREAFAADLADIGGDTSLVPPGGWKADLLEATGNTYEMFFKGIEFANLEISIALAGANLSSEVTAGSLAAAKVHGDIRADLIRDDAKALSLCLREQSLKPWCLYQYGNQELAPTPEWDTKPPVDEKALGEGMAALGNGIQTLNAAISSYGQRLQLSAVLEQTGFTQTEVNNAVNQPPAAQ